MIIRIWIFFLLAIPLCHADDWIYTVHPGDNLWDIADKYLQKGVFYTTQLKTLNKISTPTKLPPGSRIRIPLRWLKYQPAPVIVKTLQGRCRATIGQQQPIDLIAGKQLHTGDILNCLENSSMTLQFADGSRLLVQKNSHLILDTVSEYAGTGMVDTRIRLQRGEIDTQVRRKKGPGSRYEIITPSAVAAVRGTDFRIHADEEGLLMHGEVLQGNVNTTARGVKRSIKEGFGVTVQTGRPPSRPVKLLPPISLGQLPKRIDHLPVSFQWPEMDGAFQYRIQIAPDDRFDRLLFDQKTIRARIKIPDLADGNYLLRLRAIDYSGLEGLNAVSPFIVNARPEPPIPLNPKNGGTLYNKRPKFWWSKPVQASAFHFQLAADEKFETRIIDQENFDESQFVPDLELEPGNYYWLISSYDENGKQGPDSEIQNFTIKDKPIAPEVTEPNVDEERIHFRWKTDPEAVSYLFQLADHEEFSEIMIEQQVEENSFSLPFSEIEPDTYYFRIRTINEDGVSGAFSTIQELEIPSDFSPYWSVLLLLVLIPILL